MRSREVLRVRVTVGAGFLCSKLCGRLIERGMRVGRLDDWITGGKQDVHATISGLGDARHLPQPLAIARDAGGTASDLVV